jgi:hypothetical protein
MRILKPMVVKLKGGSESYFTLYSGFAFTSKDVCEVFGLDDKGNALVKCSDKVFRWVSLDMFEAVE